TFSRADSRRSDTGSLFSRPRWMRLGFLSLCLASAVQEGELLSPVLESGPCAVDVGFGRMLDGQCAQTTVISRAGFPLVLNGERGEGWQRNRRAKTEQGSGDYGDRIDNEIGKLWRACSFAPPRFLSRRSSSQRAT